MASKYTEDNFKIVDFLPPDDSDISDAFSEDGDSHSDKELTKTQKCPIINSNLSNDSSKTNSKYTEDNFKIVDSLPIDDANISDGFSEDEDDKILNTIKSHAKNNVSKNKSKTTTEKVVKPINNNENTLVRRSKFKKCSLQDLIDEFGITPVERNTGAQISEKPNFIVSKKKRKRKGTKAQTKKNTETLASKRKQNNDPSDLEVLDYSQLRKSQKKNDPFYKKESLSAEKNQETIYQTMNERVSYLKKGKHDLFMLSLKGFDKPKAADEKVRIAVKLGAKPPKRKPMNYKNLQKLIKDEKQKNISMRELPEDARPLLLEKPLKKILKPKDYRPVNKEVITMDYGKIKKHVHENINKS